MLPRDVFDRLMDQIHLRAQTLPEGSYTTKLLRGGAAAMGAKVTEEAAEVVEAAQQLQSAQQLLATQRLQTTHSGAQPQPDAATSELRQHLIYEAGDVVYHLWVLLGSFGITVDELRSELQRREGTSGLEEKRLRNDKA